LEEILDHPEVFTAGEDLERKVKKSKHVSFQSVESDDAIPERAEEKEMRDPPSSFESVQSVLSAEQDKVEEYSKDALLRYLDLISDVSETSGISSQRAIFPNASGYQGMIRVGVSDHRSISDGVIMREAAKIPQVTIECKRRQNSYRRKQLIKLPAQQFGEMLAVAQGVLIECARIHHAFDVIPVFLVGIYHRRVFCVRCGFAWHYLFGVLMGEEPQERIQMKRSKLYRLDKEDEIQEFSTFLMHLFRQLSQVTLLPGQ
jgi:hypothetical protein